MALPNRLSLFPQDLYNRVMEKAVMEGVFSIACASPKEAKYQQSLFYRYRILLRKEKHTDLADQADTLIMRVLGKGKTTSQVTVSYDKVTKQLLTSTGEPVHELEWRLEFSPRIGGADAMRIAKALGDSQ